MTAPFSWSDETIAFALRNEPRLRGIARALLADPAAQDDVVSETIAKAALKPPQRPRALAKYLATILRNRAKERARAAVRRARFESHADPPRELPSPEEVFDREQVRRVVLDAVRRLDEPYRSTIVWIFLEDVPAHELAARLGVPESTIRTRQQRALAKLRERLSAAFAPDGRDWRVALAPFAGLEIPLGSGAAVPSVLLLKKAAAVLAVASTLAAALLLHVDEEQTPAGSGVVGEREHAGAAGGIVSAVPEVLRRSETPAESAGAGSPAAASAFDSPEHAFCVRGRILDRFGHGAADGRVAVIEFDARLSPTTVEPSPDPVVRRVVSSCSADGSFLVAGLRRGARRVFLFSSGGHTVGRALECEPPPGETLELPAVRIEPPPVHRGKVVGEGSTPLPGARLSVVPGAVSRFGLLPFLWGLRFENLDSDGVIVAERADDAGNPACDVFPTPESLRETFAEFAPPVAVSAADGSFEIAGLPDPGAVLLVTHDAARTRTIRFADHLSRDSLEIELLPASRYEVIVRDETGTPIAGAEVYAGARSTGGRPIHALRRVGVTDREGRVAAIASTEGAGWIAARRAPDAAFVAVGPIDLAGVIECTIPPSEPFVLEVRRGDGEAVAGLRVEAHRGRPAGELLAKRLASPRDAAPEPLGSGRFRCEPLAAGEWRLLVTAEGCAPAWLDVALPAPDPIELVMQLERCVEIEVVDRAGIPIAGVEGEIRADPPEPHEHTVVPEGARVDGIEVLPRSRSVSDVRGRLRFARLGAEAHAVTLRHPAFSDRVVGIDASSRSLRVALAPRGRVEGVVFENGVPLAASRRVRIESDARWDRLASVVTFVDTDAAGRFRCAGLAAGRYRVSIEPDAAAAGAPLDSLERLLSSRSDRRSSTSFTLSEGGYAYVQHEENPYFAAPDEPAVTVLGAVAVDDAPLAGATIGVMTRGEIAGSGVEGITAVTDGTGAFRVERVVAPKDADSTLVVTFADLASGSRCTREVPVDGATEVRVDFRLRSASLRGVVRGADGAPRSCRVNLFGEAIGGGRVGGHAQAGSDGRYEFERLLAGTYDVQVYSDEGNSMRRGVRVEPGPNTVDLELLAYNDIRGRVDVARLDAAEDSAITAILMMEPPLMNYWPRSPVGADGIFAFEGVMPGSYDLCFVVEGRWSHAPRLVTLAERAIEGLWVEPVPRDPPEYPLPPFPRKRTDVVPDPRSEKH